LVSFNPLSAEVILEGMKHIELTHGQKTLVSDEDFEMLSKYHWMARLQEGKYRAFAEKWHKGKRTRIVMSRLIVDSPKNMVVDHINGDTLDNRRDNLRICTRTQNLQNRKLNKNSKSGYKGVTAFTVKIKTKIYFYWRVWVSKDSKNVSLGYFKDKREAALIYNNYAVRNYGEFAKLNDIVFKGAAL
jgi:hypothetical protein